VEILLPITTFFALFGAWLVSNGKWWGFAIWIVTDIIFMINNVMISQWEQAILFGLYLFIAANGVYNMKFKKT
jgi:hypothetical protein